MAKKKQFVTAAAAFAVAASAVAPAITADAATQTVRLKTDYVRSANLDAVLDQEYKGSEIHWYKSSIDLNKLGVFQTAKGFVKGKGIKVEKSLRVLNYVKEVQPAKEIVLEQGVPASGLRIQPVLFADGNLYNKPVSVSGFNTDKVGEFEGQFTYANKAFGSVTTKVKYKVVATKVAISEVKSEVNDDVLSVTADVKNLKDGEKVELVIYAGRDLNAALPAVQAEVKDGKLSVKSGKLPAGNHSFILRSGEVKTEVMNFVVEGPMVKEVKAINAKEVTVTFNKAVDADTVLGTSNVVKNISFTGVGTATNPGTLTGKLSADGKTLTVSALNTFNGSYAIATTEDIKTVAGAKVDKFEKVVSLVDEVRPTVSSPEYLANGKATFTFSEPINATQGELANAIKLTDASGASYTPVVTLAANKKSFVLDLTDSSFTAGKTYSVAISSLVDYAGNLMTPNPAVFTVVKKAVDEVKPTVESISSKQAGYVVVNFSEKVTADAGNVVATVGGVSADLDTNATLDTSGRVLTVRSSSFNGIKDITVTSFSDVAGNIGDAKTSLVNFPVDTVNPTVASKEVKVIDNKLYLVLTFSEDVTVTNTAANNITGTYINESGVEKTVAAIDDTTTNVSAVSGTKNQVKVLIDAQEKGNYNVTLPAGLVTDVVANANVSSSVAYTVGTSTSEKIKPSVVSSIQSGNNNEITVLFSEEVGASALDLNNYLIEGSVIAEKAVFTTDAKTTVKLTLKEGAIKKSGTYNFTVKNVADVVGNVMETETSQKYFEENDKPALTSAVLTSNNISGNSSIITLTFDEAILPASIVESSSVADFGIFLDDAALPGAIVSETMGTTTNQVLLTINRSLTAVEAAKTITLKPTTDFNVADLEGNLHPTFTSVTVSK
ncbi:Ig-like domain-containing protein [Exiguobacterium sp. AM39-5BH]|uniref:Ig-like domain-containing protein n=1 Tax=Exiguobacterium sp. AM39-5BH TaxID=2292355 RepID=UPI0013141402|nr:Ig-like domain-containing protein [Exiguobacterium sp. AM39-5BH]